CCLLFEWVVSGVLLGRVLSELVCRVLGSGGNALVLLCAGQLTGTRLLSALLLSGLRSCQLNERKPAGGAVLGTGARHRLLQPARSSWLPRSSVEMSERRAGPGSNGPLPLAGKRGRGNPRAEDEAHFRGWLYPINFFSVSMCRGTAVFGSSS